MNLYILVEGRRTEMAVYPAYLRHIVPKLTRVDRPFDARENNYYIVSGFGYPNLLGHIENCIRDINKYNNYDYLMICLDADKCSIRRRVKEVTAYLSHKKLWPANTKIKIIIQKKCIETWFLASDLNEPYKSADILSDYIGYYDVFEKDPEQMREPPTYHGSVGDYHYDYLTKLIFAGGDYYTKRNPYVVCKEGYIESLIRRTKETPHLNTFSYFLRFCERLNEEI